MNSSLRIVVMADDERIRRQLRQTLPPNGYAYIAYPDAEERIARYRAAPPAAFLIDLDFARRRGFAFVRNIRQPVSTPLILLSERDAMNSEVRALEPNCIVRPFETGEILSRLQRAIWESAQFSGRAALFRSGPLTLDLVNRHAFLGGREIRLASKEFALLRYLAEHAGRVVTHKQILERVWGPNSLEHSEYVRVLVRALRKKFEGADGAVRLIVSEFGVGYRLTQMPPQE